MTAHYFKLVRTIADAMVAAMQFRMVTAGDDRPLFVYVSHQDGGWTIGHDGQHVGYWRAPRPCTIATDYNRVAPQLADDLRTAPLYAGQVEHL
jgi:hypothetical protein